ncbi:MAG: hypothetical protein U0168_03425 [Nannocystaceae bacterium]
MRTRTKSAEPRAGMMSRRPLWPPWPPPCFTATRPSTKSISSCATITLAAGTWKNLAAAATEAPERFMYVCGCSTTTRPCSVDSVIVRAWNFSRHSSAPGVAKRSAQRSTAMNPTL